VNVNVTDTSGNVQSQEVITTSALFVNAGTVNTSKLLVRAAALGDIKDLPDGVGQGYGSNGDQIYVWADLAQDLGAPQGGPVIYGSFEWDNPNLANTVIQASIPPIGLNLNALSFLLPGASALDLDLHSTLLVGYGVSPSRGQFVYNSSTDQVDLQWPSGGDATIDTRINQRIRAITGSQSVLVNSNSVTDSTWHSLGGACMNSVCDLEGRVLGQQGLYVLDGALMPGTTGACNPSMTIAAIAERALDQIVQNDVGIIF